MTSEIPLRTNHTNLNFNFLTAGHTCIPHIHVIRFIYFLFLIFFTLVQLLINYNQYDKILKESSSNEHGIREKSIFCSESSSHNCCRMIMELSSIGRQSVAHLS